MAKKSKHENLGWGDRGGKKRHQESEEIEASPNIFVVTETGSRRSPGWFIRIFCLPHTIIGICLPFVATAAVMTHYFGVETNGTVTGFGKSEKSPTVKFDFTVGDKTMHHSDTVERHYSKEMSVGDPVRVKYWSVAPEPTAIILYPERKNNVGFLLIFTAFWDAIILPVGFFLYVWPVVEWYKQNYL